MKHLLLFLLLVTVSFAETTVNVAVDHFPPLSYKSNGQYTGFDIDLIKAIAEENNWNINLVDCPTVTSIIDTVQEGKADIGISGISITGKRYDKVDFSLPYFDTSIGYLAKKDQASIDIPAKYKEATLSIIKTAVLNLFIVLTIYAHFIWIIERFNGNDNHFNKGYFKGIGDGYWWSMVTVTTVGYGDKVPLTFIGRFVASLVMISGLIWWGYLSGSLGGAIINVLDNAEYNIESINHKVVGTKQGSTSYKYLSRYTTSDIKEYTNANTLCADVINGNIDLACFDKPVLMYGAESNKDLVFIDKNIEPQQYGIALNKNKRDLEKTINKTLLKFKANGQYNMIYNRWFKKGENCE
jgi:ABC-type amino acid transport substrate-binding protein